MKNKFAKIALMSGLLALVFTYGCSSDNGGSGGNSGSSEADTLSYNGKTYKTVKIGDQRWMSENLNYDTTDSKCYNNNEANCEKYGRLYNWTAAVSVCPPGWHLPSNKDWDKLYHYVDGNDYNGDDDNDDDDGLYLYESPTAGGHLKATSGWDNGGNGKDKCGFAALPGGFGSSIATFYNLGSRAFWWSSSPSYNNNAYSRGMYHDNEHANWFEDIKTYYFSVRCLQNQPK